MTRSLELHSGWSLSLREHSTASVTHMRAKKRRGEDFQVEGSAWIETAAFRSAAAFCSAARAAAVLRRALHAACMAAADRSRSARALSTRRRALAAIF